MPFSDFSTAFRALLWTSLAISPSAWAAAAMDGMEVTQAVQFYRSAQHLSTSSDYGSDNSIPLATGKAAYVRIYVKSTSAAPLKVTGALLVERQQGPLWQSLGTINASGSVTAAVAPAYKTVRGDTRRTLNFVMPPDMVAGVLRLTATVKAADGSGSPARGEWTLPVTIDRTLRIAAITVGYHGPPVGGAGTITASPPTLADVQATAALAAAVFPVRATVSYRIAGSITQTVPLLVEPGLRSCPPTWTDLMIQIRKIRTADGPRPGWLYFGLLAPQVPYKSNTVGCGGGGVGTGKVGAGWTMAHELAHGAGLSHVPGPPRPAGKFQCTPAGADKNYPGYAPYGRGSVGEYGLDIRSGTVHAPGGHRDMMQYCSPFWISPYNYRKLLDAPILQIPDSSAALTSSADFEPLVVVLGVMDTADRISKASAVRLSARRAPVGEVAADMMAEVLDDAGQILSTAPVYASRMTERGASATGRQQCPCIIEASMQDLPGGASVRIRKGADVLWEARVTESLANVTLTSEAQSSGIKLSWNGVPPGTEVWLRASSDQGKTWSVVDVGQLDGAFFVPGSRMADAGNHQFELLVPSGFTTTPVTSVPSRR